MMRGKCNRNGYIQSSWKLLKSKKQDEKQTQKQWLHPEQLKLLKSKKEDERQIQQDWLHPEQLKLFTNKKEDERQMQ